LPLLTFKGHSQLKVNLGLTRGHQKTNHGYNNLSRKAGNTSGLLIIRFVAGKWSGVLIPWQTGPINLDNLGLLIPLDFRSPWNLCSKYWAPHLVVSFVCVIVCRLFPSLGVSGLSPVLRFQFRDMTVLPFDGQCSADGSYLVWPRDEPFR